MATQALKPTKKGVQITPSESAIAELVSALYTALEGGGPVILEETGLSEDPIVVSLSEYQGTPRLDIRHWYYP